MIKQDTLYVIFSFIEDEEDYFAWYKRFDFNNVMFRHTIYIEKYTKKTPIAKHMKIDICNHKSFNTKHAKNVIDYYTDKQTTVELLQSFTNIKYLYVHDNLNVPYFSKIRRLEIRKLDDESFTHICHLTTLTSLKMSDCTLTSCNGIQSLSNLIELDVSNDWHNYLNDVTHIGLLKNLQVLKLCHCDLQTFESLTSLTCLTILHLVSILNIASLQGIEKCEELEELYVSWCEELHDITHVKQLKKLEKLNFNECRNLDFAQLIK